MDRKTHYQWPDPEMQEVVIAALLMAAFGSLVGRATTISPRTNRAIATWCDHRDL
jgi:hypothetical protein